MIHSVPQDNDERLRMMQCLRVGLSQFVASFTDGPRLRPRALSAYDWQQLEELVERSVPQVRQFSGMERV